MTSNESSSPSADRRRGPIRLRPCAGILTPADEAICARAVRDGGLLAFPTDTVYGVGADAGAPAAVRWLFEAKRRPAHQPLPVLVSGPEAFSVYARRVPDEAWALAAAFWPGPLTIVVLRTDAICPEAVAGGDTVGLRMPDHPVALQVLRAAGGPVAATSANLSGGQSTVSSAEVLRTLGPWLEVLVEDPGVGSGLPSTVIDLTAFPPQVLRWGGVGLPQLVPVLGYALQPDEAWPPGTPPGSGAAGWAPEGPPG